MPTYDTTTDAYNEAGAGVRIRLMFQATDPTDARRQARDYIRRVWGRHICRTRTIVERIDP